MAEEWALTLAPGRIVHKQMRIHLNLGQGNRNGGGADQGSLLKTGSSADEPKRMAENQPFQMQLRRF